MINKEAKKAAIGLGAAYKNVLITNLSEYHPLIVVSVNKFDNNV